jgi:BAI1-associated protein 3
LSFQKRRPPSFFANLLAALKDIVATFWCRELICTDQDNLNHVNRLVLHACETSELIHQYYKLRLTEQKAMEDQSYGQLTIQCCFRGNTLEINIMNARDLRPMNIDGTCDSIVKVHFSPEEKFTDLAISQTTEQKNTLCPLFDHQIER